MVNYIWGGMIVIGLIVSAFNGRLDDMNGALFEGAKNGVEISFMLISVLVLWMGIMKIAEQSGLLNLLAKILRPVVRMLFPDVPKDHPAQGYILSNMSANLLGLGNAATPMGLKAMQELQRLNPDKDTASKSMITLLALNTSSLTIIPTMVINYRQAKGSLNPVEIVGPAIIATMISTIAAILLDRYYQRKDRTN
jgi:spore maturation protein A